MIRSFAFIVFLASVVTACGSSDFPTARNETPANVPVEEPGYPPPYQPLVSTKGRPVELSNYWIESERKLPPGQFELFQITLRVNENGRFAFYLQSRVRDTYHYGPDKITEYFFNYGWQRDGDAIRLGRSTLVGNVRLLRENPLQAAFTIGPHFLKMGLPPVVVLLAKRCVAETERPK